MSSLLESSGVEQIVQRFMIHLEPSWRNALGGFFIHLTLGGIYLWGNITNSVTSHVRLYQPNLTYDDTDIVYGVALGVIGVAMVIGGLLEKYLGSPKVALLGGSLISLSCFLASIAKSLVGLILTQGVMFGLGFGIAFAAPISCAVRWSPCEKGLLSGVISSGLGCGAFLFGFLCNAIVNPSGQPVNDAGYFPSDGPVSNRVPMMYGFMGTVYGVLVLIGYSLLVDKESQDPFLLGTDVGKKSYSDNRNNRGDHQPGYVSASTVEDDVEMLFGVSANDIDQSVSGDSSHAVLGYNQASSEHERDPAVGTARSTDEYRSQIGLDTLYKNPLAWHIAISFTLTAATGMYVAGTFKTFGQTFISNERYLIGIASASSLFNMSGRLFWGYLGDRYGAFDMIIVLSLFFSLLLGFYSFTSYFGLYVYAVWTCLIFLFEGGNFTLYMSIIVYLFGSQHAATNYGSIFFVFSILNVSNVTLLSLLRQDYDIDFFYLGSLTFIGFISVLILKRKVHGGGEDVATSA